MSMRECNTAPNIPRSIERDGANGNVVALGTNKVPFRIPCDYVNQTHRTDRELKVLAVSN